MLEAQCPRRVSTALRSLHPKSGYQRRQNYCSLHYQGAVSRLGVYRLSIFFLLMFTFNAIARQSISAQGAVSRRVSTALRSQRPNWVPER